MVYEMFIIKEIRRSIEINDLIVIDVKYLFFYLSLFIYCTVSSKK